MKYKRSVKIFYYYYYYLHPEVYCVPFTNLFFTYCSLIWCTNMHFLFPLCF